MNKKRSFSSEFKLELVLKYINDHQSYIEISKVVDIDHSVIRRWVSLYKPMGILGLEISKSKTIYSLAFKVSVVKYMNSNVSSLFDASLKFEAPISFIFNGKKIC
jgi:transposase